MPQRTPLFATHQRLGARLIEFGGWEMPLQYAGILEEHQAVRTAAGLFDISHMGEVWVRGAGAAAFLDHTLTNNVRKLPPGKGQYTLMCNERGGVVDDLYVYRTASEEYLLILNAARIEPDAGWLARQLALWPDRHTVGFENASPEWGGVAVQGPVVSRFIDACFPLGSGTGPLGRACSDLKKNEIQTVPLAEQTIYVGRTGYTGEDGFEVIAPAGLLEMVWNRIEAAGRPLGLQPAGLGARDTLRLEVCYPLYGHELDENTTPIEAGLSFAVALEKEAFLGKEVLARQKAEGVSRKCVAFKLVGKAPPPRPGYSIWSADTPGKRLGPVASGTQSPSLGIGIGTGFLPPAYASAGTELTIEIRGRRVPARVASRPLYRKAI